VSGQGHCLRCLEDPRRLERSDRYVIDGVRHVATDELDAVIDRAVQNATWLVGVKDPA
jgi:hypothetical protein